MDLDFLDMFEFSESTLPIFTTLLLISLDDFKYSLIPHSFTLESETLNYYLNINLSLTAITAYNISNSLISHLNSFFRGKFIITVSYDSIYNDFLVEFSERV